MLAEDCSFIDAAELARPLSGSLVTFTTTRQDGQATQAAIKLTTTVPRFRGQRYWHVCPSRGRGVRGGCILSRFAKRGLRLRKGNPLPLLVDHGPPATVALGFQFGGQCNTVPSTNVS